MDKPISVWCSKELRDKIQELADKENRSLSNYIVNLIKKEVENNDNNTMGNEKEYS